MGEQRAAARAALAHALDGLSQADADVQARLSAARGQIGELLGDRDALSDRTESEQTRLEGLRVRQGDLRGRIDVLEELERSLEGLGAGVREVLGRLAQTAEAAEEDSPFADVLGLVADLLTVPRDIAPLVELALGDAAQRFVVRTAAAVDAVAGAVGEVAGRVGFVPVAGAVAEDPTPQPPPPRGEGEKEPTPSGFVTLPPELATPPSADSPFPSGRGVGGVGSSLVELVTCDHPDCSSLPAQLLGRVLLAETLADARTLAELHPGNRVVTRSGELLEPDGTLTVGPLKAEAGLVSRKSELRELREQHRTTSELIARAEVARRGTPQAVRRGRRRHRSRSRGDRDSFRRGRRFASADREAAAAGRKHRRRTRTDSQRKSHPRTAGARDRSGVARGEDGGGERPSKRPRSWRRGSRR